MLKTLWFDFRILNGYRYDHSHWFDFTNFFLKMGHEMGFTLGFINSVRCVDASMFDSFLLVPILNVFFPKMNRLWPIISQFFGWFPFYFSKKLSLSLILFLMWVLLSFDLFLFHWRRRLMLLIFEILFWFFGMVYVSLIWICYQCFGCFLLLVVLLFGLV